MSFFETYCDINRPTVVFCNQCNEWSPEILWKEIDVYCEDCGEHPGTECPLCGHIFDWVWDSEKLKFK